MNVRGALQNRTYEGSLRFEVEEVSVDHAIGRMAVQPGVLNPFGTVHAGALIWFADVVATYCAIGDLQTVEENGQGFPVAVDLHSVLLANERDGDLTATARCIRRGRQVVVVGTAITGKAGRVLLEMTTTHLRSGSSR